MALDLTEQFVEELERSRAEQRSAPRAEPPASPSVSMEEFEAMRQRLAESEANAQAARDLSTRLSEEVRNLEAQVAERRRTPLQPPAPDRDGLARRINQLTVERDDLEDQLASAKRDVNRLVELRYRNQT